MKHRATNVFFASAAALALALAGCGGTSPSSGSTVSGVATAEEAVRSVILRDSSVPPQERTAETDSEGAFSFDVAGLNPPFVLKAVDSSGTSHYALLSQPGTVTIDGLTTAAVRSALESEDDDDDGEHDDDDEDWSRSSRRAPSIESILTRLRTVLAPLFQQYGVKKFGEDMDETRAYRAMAREVGFAVKDGTFTVTNKATGAVIYSAPLRDLTSGVLHPENIPGAGGTPTPPPPSTCTYAYGAWGACQSNGTQTRTVASSSPAGCTGTPVLSQACTYVPPVTTCSSFTYSAWGACQSNNTQARTVASSAPAGCTGGSPVLTQSCTPPPVACTYTTGAWGACQSNGTQTRTVSAGSPAGCTGTPPASNQACTYTPPACTYTYSAWSTCSASGQQTRTVASSTPSGCAGTPILTQSCTPPPPPSCTTCHATPPATGRHSLHVSRGISCASCHGTGYSATTANDATHRNGTVNLTAGGTSCNTCHGSKSW